MRQNIDSVSHRRTHTLSRTLTQEKMESKQKPKWIPLVGWIDVAFFSLLLFGREESSVTCCRTIRTYALRFVESSRVHPAQCTVAAVNVLRAVHKERRNREKRQRNTKTHSWVRDICIVVALHSAVLGCFGSKLLCADTLHVECIRARIHTHTQTRYRAHFRLHVSTRTNAFFTWFGCCCCCWALPFINYVSRGTYVRSWRRMESHWKGNFTFEERTNQTKPRWRLTKRN